MDIDLNQIKKVHFVGIKGVAMTALAIVVKEMDKFISGADIEEEFPTDKILKKFEINYEIGFSPKHISSDIDLVIYTGAHQGSHNIEVLTAIKKGIPVLSHGEALGRFMIGKYGISVAGSHGKTTTSAMMAHILFQCGYDPSFAIGCGEILSLKTPAHYGKGKYFVAEADEYVTDPTANKKPRFLWQYPELLIITNIDFDHPDAYVDITKVQQAFVKFTENVSDTGLVICNLDDPNTKQILPKINKKIITYGTNKEADFVLLKVEYSDNQTTFTVLEQGKKPEDYILKIPGFHNALNATAIIAGLKSIGISSEKIKLGLKTFIGTKRRFEFIGLKHDKLFYDDYAHHPAEIFATLKGVRDWFPKKRIIVIFQPHTYSRTSILLKQFGVSFYNADRVIICDIYGSQREKTLLDVSGKLLYQEILKHKKDVYYAPKLPDVLEYLKINAKSNDLIITMGAGDIYSWIDSIYSVL